MTDDMEPTNPEFDAAHTEPFWPDDPAAVSAPTDPPGALPPFPPGEAPLTEPTEPKKPSWKTWVAVAGAAAVVGAAAVFGISAASSSDSSNAAASTQNGGTGATGGSGATQGPGGQGFPGGLGGFGKIATIDGANLTIKNAQTSDTTKVVTSSDTKVTKTVSGSLDDIKVGDTVMVVGTGTSPDITATTVTDDGKVSADANGGPTFNGNGGPPGAGEGQFPSGGQRQFQDGQAPPNGQAPNGGQGFNGAPGGDGATTGTRGVVKSVGDGTFTVTGMDGTVVTVTTSSSTKVNVTKDGTVSDLKVGDQVMVRGETNNGTITATSIREGALGGFFRGGNRPPGAPTSGSSTG